MKTTKPFKNEFFNIRYDGGTPRTKCYLGMEFGATNGDKAIILLYSEFLISSQSVT